jgi:hypothetical protein|tara:strand:- start:2990 stop:3526 length:537 start_codon:yes stop_codon:yes gene_type:complete
MATNSGIYRVGEKFTFSMVKDANGKGPQLTVDDDDTLYTVTGKDLMTEAELTDSGYDGGTEEGAVYEITATKDNDGHQITFYLQGVEGDALDASQAEALKRSQDSNRSPSADNVTGSGTAEPDALTEVEATTPGGAFVDQGTTVAGSARSRGNLGSYDAGFAVETVEEEADNAKGFPS